MSKLNGRVKRIEAAAPPAADDDDLEWLRELCADVIAAIDAGEIVSIAERGPLQPHFHHDKNDLRPTTAGSLAGDEREHVRSLLYRSDKVVVDYARVTGWRSPIGQTKPRESRAYHANSVHELASVMRMVLDAIR